MALGRSRYESKRVKGQDEQDLHDLGIEERNCPFLGFFLILLILLILSKIPTAVSRIQAVNGSACSMREMLRSYGLLLLADRQNNIPRQH